MKELNKENLEDFLFHYHRFHDSYITSIHYDIEKSLIEMNINVGCSGEALLQDDGCYETNKKKMKMAFELVEQCNNKEIFSWNFIYEAYITYVKINNKEFICFASDDNDPLVYIVCEKIMYEEI